MDASGLDEEALLAPVAAGGEVPKAEVLLPEVVATMVAERDGPAGAGDHHRRQAGRRHPRRRPAGGQRRAGPPGGLGNPAQPALVGDRLRTFGAADAGYCNTRSSASPTTMSSSPPPMLAQERSFRYEEWRMGFSMA